MTDWKERWENLGEANQYEFMRRLAIMPPSILDRSIWYRVLISPMIFLKHYKLTREYFGRYWSIKYATKWTKMLLFWESSAKTQLDDDKAATRP